MRHSVRRVTLALSVVASVFSVSVLPAQTSQLPLVLPSAIAFDRQGNLYVADAGAHLVREVTLAGVVSIVAGTGLQGFAGDGGVATAAELDSPMGLAVDAGGNLYISDTHNQRVRKIAGPTGVITTIGGTGVPGFSGDGGPAKNAALSRPTALAIDDSGNLYVADTGNHRIRKVAADGSIATVAGGGAQGFSGDNAAAADAALDSPYGIALDASGNLYIADTHNGRIRRVAPGTGVITTVAGNGKAAFAGDGSAGISAALGFPRGLHVDVSGNIYVADTANHRIRRVSPAGTIATIAGGPAEGFSGDGGAPTGATLDSPNSVAVSPAGRATMSDAGNRRVRQIDSAGEDIESLPRLASPPSPTLTLSGPAALTYGTGTFTAILTGLAAVGQTVSIEESGTGVALGFAVLDTTGAANWGSGSLSAGTHVLQATYSGVASNPLTVVVQPAQLMATAAEVSILYGQLLPALSGSLTGVLPQDFSRISAGWTTAAGPLSSPGAYSISVALTGPAAPNYTLASVIGSVVIAKAPARVSLAISASTLVPGTPLVLTPQVASTTSGVPTGTVSLVEGTSLLGTVQVGTAFTVANLAAGTHSIMAVYSGDTNFLSTSSISSVVTVAAPVSDFTLASSGASKQTVSTGTVAIFQFNVAMQGAALGSPILLAVQGIPPGATASLNPASVPPGSTATPVTLTVETPKAGNNFPDARRTVWWAILLLPGMWRLRGKRAIRLAILSGSCILLTLLPVGCGDRMNVSASQSHTSTYTITVTGTATGPSGSALQHSADVTLEVY